MTTHDEQIGTGPKLPRRRGKSQASLDLIDAAYSFLAAQNPTSVRGVCYALFAQGLIRSMAKKETSRVSRLLRDAREDGTIPWPWIVDETRELERTAQWQNPAAYVKTVRRSYRRDFWQQQPNRVEIWSEKGTIRGVLGPVLDQYGVGFRVMHGFGSTTTVHDVADDDRSDMRPLVVAYVGDWDCSGMWMSEVDLPDRLDRYGGVGITIERVALDHRDLGALPSYSAKRSDPRYKWYVKRYGYRCWELDAMPPNDLRGRVEGRIKSLIEPKAWARCERAQEAEQASLEKFLSQWANHG